MRLGQRLCVLTALVLLVMGSTRPAQASPIVRYDFSGTVTQVDNSSGAFGSQVQTGASFALAVSLPADSPNGLGSNPDYGHYTLPQPGMSLTINGQPYALGPVDTAAIGEVGVTPANGPYDGLFYGTQTFLAPSDPSINSIRVDFSMASSTGAVSTDTLPTSLNLANFTATTPMVSLSIFYNDNRHPVALGTITSASVTVLSEEQAVPEPGTFLIVALGVFGILMTRRGVVSTPPTR
jgi:hypothetical protein